MPGHAVFAYGTLLFPEVVEIVVGRRLVGVTATLHGFRRAQLSARVYPGIVEADGASTAGLLHEALTDDDLAALDRFEDVLYDRRLVTVETGGGPRQAFAYVVSPAHRSLVTGEPWDPEGFATGLADYLLSCRDDPEGPAPTR